LKGYKPEVTNPQNCKKLVSHFIQLLQRFILCRTVTLTVQCCNLVIFSGTKIKGYFIFNFTLKYLNFRMLWVSHLWLETLQLFLQLPVRCTLWHSLWKVKVAKKPKATIVSDIVITVAYITLQSDHIHCTCLSTAP
jgi:hypothetical protein